MAFIPDEDEDSKETGMNTLAVDGQAPLAPQTQPQTDAAPNAMGQGQAPTGPAAPTGQPQSAPPKTARGSGMFTNVNKYVQANKPATAKMAGSVVGNIQKKSGAVSQGLKQQQQNMAQRYGAQKQALGQTQQVGQQVVQQASNLANQQQLQDKQNRLQSRTRALGDLQEGGYESNISDYQGQYDAFAPQVQQAQSTFDQAQSQLKQRQSALANIKNQLSPKNGAATSGFSKKELQAQLGDAQRLQSVAQTEFQTQQDALKALTGQQTQAEKQLKDTQSLQEKYLRQQDLQSQMSDITAKMAGKDQLTEEQLGQVRKFLGGEQQFNIGAIDTRGAQSTVKDLTQQARGLDSADVRKRLLKDTFGGTDYSRGESKLDELLFAKSGKLGDVRQATEQTAADVLGNVQDARRTGETTTKELGKEIEAGREQLTGSAQEKLDALKATLAERASTGGGGRLGELYQALQSPEGLSQQQLEALGGSQKLYGLDLAETMQDVLKEQQLGLGDVATATEQNRINALNSLLGQESQLDFGQVGESGYTEGEQGVFEGLKSKIAERTSAFKKAESNVIQHMSKQTNGASDPINSNILSWARSGREPSNADLYKLQSDNYWAWAGKGAHGVAIPLTQLKSMINTARNQINPVDETYKRSQGPIQAFQSQDEEVGGIVAKDGAIKRRALRKLLGRK